MQLRIIKSFLPSDSPLPFRAGDVVTLPDAQAKQWIADGLAKEFVPAMPVPAKRRRERAVTA